ncbi:MAG: tetratricopeptide repeat protein [Acidobacteriota bacterium]|nr:tetratricopeptide repeat protein [Acidobacteriota bacterium]
MEQFTMINTRRILPAIWLSLASASLFCAPALLTAQSGAKPQAAATKDSNSASLPLKDDKRAQAYFHSAMASVYEDQAMNTGRPEYVTHAIEEYKLAIDLAPDSPELNNELADLYFRIGRAGEAEATVRNLLKTYPDNQEAHELLGRIYLRKLGQSQNGVSSASPSGNTLDQAIAEFETIVRLKPNSVDDRMVLGQLYGIKHDTKKAEEQFKLAQNINPDSEEVVLNLARLYAENGNIDQAAKTLEAVAPDDRTPKMEFALGAAYDQLKKPKDAIAAYQRAADMDPSDPRTLSALGQALLNNGQLDPALKAYQQLSEVDPENNGALIHIAEIQRRQGKYEDALSTIRKANEKDPDSLEGGYNEGLLLDVLGRYDEAVKVFSHMVDLTSHANGAYTAEEKNNRGIFLSRLAAVYHEQNKTDLAIATYQKLIDMGGDSAITGYQGQVDTYRDAKMYDKAVDTARKAVAADPKNNDLKLMLAGEMADLGKADEGIAMAKSMLKGTKDDRTIWMSLAQMYTRARRWKDSDDALDKADALSSKKEDHLYILFLHGANEERQKHFEPAEKYFRQALEIDPSNAMVLNYFGYMLADKGTKLPEALQMIRKAVEQDPLNGAYLDSLGWAYFKLGQYELAEDNLRRAVSRNQTDPTVHDHLGDLYEKTGRIRLAAAQWELSLSEFSKTAAEDVEPSEVAKVQKKLEGARVKLAKQETLVGQPNPE